jgi:integrase
MSFERWLIDHNYRQSTARQSARQIVSIQKKGLGGAPITPLRRYADYLRERGPTSTFDQEVLDLELAPLRKLSAKPKRAQLARSFQKDDWRRLRRALLDDECPESIVLQLQMATGHRVGDILRISKRGLRDAMRTGILQMERKGGNYIEVPLAGAQETWDRLRDAWHGDSAPSVADWVSPGGGFGAESGFGAYRKVSRYMKKLGERLELDGRVHTHRLRRTVGVRALAMTKDVHAVQQLLGHASIQTTLGYVDELRADDVAALQRKLGQL